MFISLVAVEEELEELEVPPAAVLEAEEDMADESSRISLVSMSCM